MEDRNELDEIIGDFISLLSRFRSYLKSESMVIVSQPTFLIQNGTQYAVLVSRTNSVDGERFYFVGCNAAAKITPPPNGARYGNIQTTRANAIANLPAGFTQVTTVNPGALSIQVGAIFSGVQIAVAGGASPWELQVSVNNTGFTSAGAFNNLEALNPAFNFGPADGAINYQALVSGNYQFRVISAGLTSNIATIFVQAGETGGGGGGGTIDIRDGSWEFMPTASAIGSEAPGFNVYALDPVNMRYNVSRPVTANFAKGFSFFTTSGQNPAPGGFQKFTNWGQAPVFFPGTENNAFRNGQVTYYFRPSGYDFDTSTNMFDFYRLFPEFQLPTGKLVVFEPGVGRRDTYGTVYDTSAGFGPLLTDKAAHRAMITRGASHVKDIQDTNPQNTMKFLGDVWMLEIGYPSDGTNPLPDHDTRLFAWTQANTPQQILDLWINIHLSDPTSENYLGNVGYYMWNFELQQAWPRVNPSHFNAFINLLISYCEANVPNLQVSIWRYAGAKVMNFSDTFNFYTIFNYLLTNPQLTLSQVKSYIDSSAIGLNNGVMYKEGLFNSKAVQQVGFYQVYLRANENPLSFLLNYIINKRLSPLSKVVSIFWSDIEGVPDSDFELANVSYNVLGNTRTVSVKPRVGFSTMQTLACWSLFFMDGAHMWEVIRWNQDIREGLYRDPQFGVPGGNALPNTFPYSSLKGLDWFMCGVWAIAANRDIIDAATTPVFVNNSAFVLFTNNEFSDPLIAYKLSADGQTALVLITDFTARLPFSGGAPRVHTVTINGKNYNIETYYRFTTVARVTL